MDREINELKKNILLSINSSGLPISVIYLILRDITTSCGERQLMVLNEIYSKEGQGNDKKENVKKGENKDGNNSEHSNNE